jgi:hypothetical protein
MRTRRNTVALALAAVAVLTLAGCVQSPAHVIPTSEPSSKPVFASNAAALAAAKKAYVAYLAVSDTISNDGGKGAQTLQPLVTKQWLPTETQSYATFAKTGERFTGATGFDSFRLQSLSVNHGLAEVTVYVCANVSKTRLLDATGSDITPGSRQDVYPIVVSFESAAAASRRLLFAGSEPWSGKNYC